MKTMLLFLGPPKVSRSQNSEAKSNGKFVSNLQYWLLLKTALPWLSAELTCWGYLPQ